MLRSRLATELIRLREHLERVNARLEALDREVHRLRGASELDTQVLVVREMSREEVQSRALQVFAERGTTDVAQLHEAIRCDLGVLLDVLDELRANGRLEEA